MINSWCATGQCVRVATTQYLWTASTWFLQNITKQYKTQSTLWGALLHHFFWCVLSFPFAGWFDKSSYYRSITSANIWSPCGMKLLVSHGARLDIFLLCADIERERRRPTMVSAELSGQYGNAWNHMESRTLWHDTFEVGYRFCYANRCRIKRKIIY